MLPIFNGPSDWSADGMCMQAPDDIVVLLLVLWRHKVTTTAYRTSLPVHSSISNSCIDRTEFRNSRQLNTHLIETWQTAGRSPEA
jgi:hypothetical protein